MAGDSAPPLTGGRSAISSLAFSLVSGDAYCSLTASAMEERCFFSAGISRSYRLRMSRTDPPSGNCSESLLLPAKSRNTPKKSTRTCIAHQCTATDDLGECDSETAPRVQIRGQGSGNRVQEKEKGFKARFQP